MGKRKKSSLLGNPVVAKPVTECGSIDEVFKESLTSFGGGYLKRIYKILFEIFEKNIPLVVTIAGPITISDQHQAWLIPLLKTGRVAYLTVTDAICYHDAHDSLGVFAERQIKEVPIFGDDGQLRDEGIIRITDTGFHEKVLFDQDRMISAILQRPEFQKAMTTTERNFLLGKYYDAQEKFVQARPGLLSTCHHMGIPVFVGAPGDGSAFLNSMKLWKMSQLSLGYWYQHSIDIHQDVYEACAYHNWGLFMSPAKKMAILILGGGVPKNYALQPEPTLSQIFGLPNIKGYDYDVQIVSAPVTDGSLSSCFPSEAVSWGKINKKTYRQKTESMQGDYSAIMPLMMFSLLKKFPGINAGYHLFSRRDELTKKLDEKIKKNLLKMGKTNSFPLALKD